MAIAFDNSSTLAIGTGTRSWTHTPTGTPKGVIVVVVQDGTSSSTTGVTYGGTAMSNTVTATSTSAEPGRVSVWFLGSGLGTGAKTIQVTQSSTTNSYAAAAATVTGDYATTAVVTSDSGATLSGGPTTATSMTVSLTIPSGVQAFAMGGLHSGQNAPGSITDSAATTDLMSPDFGTKSGMADYVTSIITGTGSANTNLSWTQGAEDAAWAGIAIQEWFVSGSGSLTTSPAVAASASVEHITSAHAYAPTPNLAPNGEFEIDLSNYGTSGAITLYHWTGLGVDGGNYLSFSTSASNSWVYIQNTGAEVGKQYIVSLWAKKSSTVQLTIGTSYSFIAATSWTRYSTVITYVDETSFRFGTDVGDGYGTYNVDRVSVRLYDDVVQATGAHTPNHQADAAITQASVVTNGDFETDLSGWIVGTTANATRITTEGAPYPTGSAAVRIQANTPSGGGTSTYIRQLIALNPSKVYRVSFWCRRGSQGSPYLSIGHDSYGDVYLPTTEWQSGSFLYRPTTSAARNFVVGLAYDYATGDELYLDDIRIEEWGVNPTLTASGQLSRTATAALATSPTCAAAGDVTPGSGQEHYGDAALAVSSPANYIANSYFADLTGWVSY